MTFMSLVDSSNANFEYLFDKYDLFDKLKIVHPFRKLEFEFDDFDYVDLWKKNIKTCLVDYIDVSQI